MSDILPVNKQKVPNVSAHSEPYYYETIIAMQKTLYKSALISVLPRPRMTQDSRSENNQVNNDCNQVKC